MPAGVVEYNFYAHRAIEATSKRWPAKAGYTAFDSELELLVDENGVVVQPIYRDEKGQITQRLGRVSERQKIKFKDLPPLAGEGAHDLKEMWANITYFLKAAVPAAEKAGCSWPSIPTIPRPRSAAVPAIHGKPGGWKHIIEIVKSPANGITFDCGVTREMGEDPVAVAEYFAGRKRINHAHFRNVLVEKPYERYQEVFHRCGPGRHVRSHEGAGTE